MRDIQNFGWKFANSGRCIIVVILTMQTAWCAAFNIPEIGTRATGMGSAFIAVADDGSALYYNPAGIAFQQGFRIEMDGTLVHGEFHFIPSAVPRGTVVPRGGYDGYISPKIIAVPNLFVTKSINQRWTVGFGAFSPFGLGGNWTNFKDSDPTATKFVARFVVTRPKMVSLWSQPTIAYRINDRLSLAAGVAYVHTYVLLEQSI